MKENIKERLPNPPFLVQLIIAFALIPLTGLVIKLLWGWFVVPFGITPITIWHGAGIGILMTYLARSQNDLLESYGFWYVTFIAVTKDLTCLLLGFLIHLFM